MKTKNVLFTSLKESQRKTISHFPFEDIQQICMNRYTFNGSIRQLITPAGSVFDTFLPLLL